MARYTNKTGNDIYVRKLADGDTVNVQDFMWGHVIGEGASIRASVDGEETNAKDWFVVAMADGGSDMTTAVQSFTLDTNVHYLHASAVTDATLVLAGARNTPVVQYENTHVHDTVLKRPV